MNRVQMVTQMFKAGVKVSPGDMFAYTNDRVMEKIYDKWIELKKPKKITVKADFGKESVDVVPEATTVGDIAPRAHGFLSVTSDLDPKQTKKRNKTRKKMNSAGKQTGQPHEFKTLENKSMKIDKAQRVKRNVIESIIKEEVFNLVVEQGDPKQVLALCDNIGKQISLSINYAKLFMSDGMKFGDDAVLDFNYKRAKAELARLSTLVKDIDKVLVKTYHHYKQNQQEEELGANECGDDRKDVGEETPPGREKQVKKLKKVLPKTYIDPKTGKKKKSNPHAVSWSSYNKSKKSESKEYVAIPILKQ